MVSKRCVAAGRTGGPEVIGHSNERFPSYCGLAALEDAFSGSANKQQIPFGDDNKKSNCRSEDNISTRGAFSTAQKWYNGIAPRRRNSMEDAQQFASYPSLRDRLVLITGGASGIGESMVEAFAAQQA